MGHKSGDGQGQSWARRDAEAMDAQSLGDKEGRVGKPQGREGNLGKERREL